MAATEVGLPLVGRAAQLVEACGDLGRLLLLLLALLDLPEHQQPDQRDHDEADDAVGGRPTDTLDLGLLGLLLEAGCATGLLALTL